MKLNKQGVRDLGYMSARKAGYTQKEIVEAARPTFGKNEMPGELASQMLATQSAPARTLPPEVQEFLVILAEECGEVVQRVTKILRFGLDSRNPWNGHDNTEGLERELGDISAVTVVLELLGVIDPRHWGQHTDRKLKAFVNEENPTRPRLRHMTPELRAKILGIL